MKNKQLVEALIADRNYIYMFMEEIEQTAAFWLWQKYSSKHQQEKIEWSHHFKINDKYFGYSPLVTAAKTGNFELAEFCLHIGADPFKAQILAGNIKITPFEIARKNGHTKLARLLEEAEKGRFFGRVKSLFWKFERNAVQKGW